MPFFLILRSVQILSDPMIIDRIKIKLFRAIVITRKIILEGGLVVVDDGNSSGNGAVVEANDAPLTVFEKICHYDYDHTSYTDFAQDFATSSECSACKCQDCKAKYDGVINAINPEVFRNEEFLINIIKGFNIPAGLFWHLVDEVYISINCGDEFHWVLAVVVLKVRHIRVYDLMSRRERFGSSSEIQKLAKILPTYLDMSGFLDEKVHTDWSMIEAYRDKMGNPFDI
ncbi:hypothetical protein T459_04503 [Capsicum annuum]|uniref:Ubiquitin-like protease family profile domain-containing protein n=1 Tax=Capsicum annuum TaxID=4072 RepID=A0A2G3A5C5_CAPAN|nr:hypothetical protein T459_04503 [Capsicum annuum]